MFSLTHLHSSDIELVGLYLALHDGQFIAEGLENLGALLHEHSSLIGVGAYV